MKDNTNTISLTVRLLIVAVVSSALGAGIGYKLYQYKSCSACSSSTHETHNDKQGEHNNIPKDNSHTELQGKDDEHKDSGDHGHDVVKLSKQEMEEFGIELGTTGPGKLQIHTTLPGEIRVNKDKSAHIVPRVPGIVQQVKKKLGDSVRKGELLAVIESRELADTKSAYLTALERLTSARSNFSREEKLWKKKISSEQEYIAAKQALAETRIELRSTEQKLHALGFSEEYLKKLPALPGASFTKYEITAPFDGTIISRHITAGEVIGYDSEIFIISDLSTVWVDISVYQKDLPFVKKGQTAVIVARHGIPEITGKISYVGPIVGEDTRTALARIIIPNSCRQYRPGVFVTVNVAVDQIDIPLLVPKSSLQLVEGRTCVFVLDEDGFEPRPVKTGRSNKLFVEIVSGITAGQKYVTKGAFTLKAQLSKSSFGHGHSH